MKKRKISQLAKALGCGKAGLDLIPPDQYLWMQKDGEPPLYRLWSWMMYQTMHWGRDSAYAISLDGRELHLKHAADDLGIDEKNIYKYWKEGVRRGLWRNGTKDEGSQRMYLCGTVTPLAADDPTIVRTYNFPPHMLTLSDCILEQIQAFPPDKQKEAFVRYGRIVEVGKQVHAELTARPPQGAGSRTRISFCGGIWASKNNRQEHKRKGATAADIRSAAATDRGSLPEVRKYVEYNLDPCTD